MHLAAGSAAGTTPWWVTIVITLGAVTLTILGNYLLAKRQADTQLAIRKTELKAVNTESRRMEKVSACSAFLVQANAAWHAGNDFFAKSKKQPIDSYREEAGAITLTLTESWLALLVVAREPTRQAADSFVVALNHFMQKAAAGSWDDKTQAPRDAFLRVLREELQADEADAPPSATEPVAASGDGAPSDSGTDQGQLDAPAAETAGAGATASRATA